MVFPQGLLLAFRFVPRKRGSAVARRSVRDAISFRRLCVDLSRHLADGAGELVGGLRAADRIFLREDEGRHAGDALVGSLLRLARDQGYVLVGRKASAN